MPGVYVLRKLPKRKNIRLKDYDYSQAGCYFITICTKDRRCIFWKENADAVGTHSVRPIQSTYTLSNTGNIVKIAIENIPKIYRHVDIDIFMIMPNHIHMIMRIEDDGRDGGDGDGRTLCVPTSVTVTVSRVIKQFKEYVTKQIGFSIWQPGFHDHIIRNEPNYQRIWQYIDENPARWADDQYYAQ